MGQRDPRGIPLAWISTLEKKIYDESRKRRAGLSQMQAGLLARQKMMDDWALTTTKEN